MRRIDADLTVIAEDFVINLLESELPEQFLFHSTQHTLNVRNSALLIGHQVGLNEDEMNILMISALFHDVGYIRAAENHESESSRMACEFLKSFNISDDEIQSVSRAILATRVPQHPGEQISEVLCDADLMHLTSEDYFEQMELLRLEWQKTGKYLLTEHQFHLHSIDFFKEHHYHSSFGRNVLESRKHSTLIRIRERIDQLKTTC